MTWPSMLHIGTIQAMFEYAVPKIVIKNSINNYLQNMKLIFILVNNF